MFSESELETGMKDDKGRMVLARSLRRAERLGGNCTMEKFRIVHITRMIVILDVKTEGNLNHGV